MKSIFSFAPAIQQQLLEFRDYAMKSPCSRIKKEFPDDRHARKIAVHKLTRELEDGMYADAHEKEME